MNEKSLWEELFGESDSSKKAKEMTKARDRGFAFERGRQEYKDRNESSDSDGYDGGDFVELLKATGILLLGALSSGLYVLFFMSVIPQPTGLSLMLGLILPLFILVVLVLSALLHFADD